MGWKVEGMGNHKDSSTPGFEPKINQNQEFPLVLNFLWFADKFLNILI